MLSITKNEAQQLRDKLLTLTAVHCGKEKDEYTIEFLHENGQVYFLRRLDGHPYTTFQLDTAKGLATGLDMVGFNVRLPRH